MFGWAIGAWIRARQERIYQDAFDRGFGWAMTERYHREHPIEYIQDCIVDDTAFDAGAQKAVDIMLKGAERHRLRVIATKRLNSLPLPPGQRPVLTVATGE